MTKTNEAAKAKPSENEDVKVTVTKRGDGKLQKGGRYDADAKEYPTYAKGETLTLPKSVADRLEDDGFVTT